MTDFGKIKAYYSVFDEQNRLEKPEGSLEFEILMDIILGHLGKAHKVLDLGGRRGQVSDRACEKGLSGHSGGSVPAAS